MKIQKKLIYAVKDGKKAFFNENNEQVRIEDLMSRFRIDDVTPVYVLLRADDGREDVIPFDIEIAKKMFLPASAERKMYQLITMEGLPVKVYTTKAAGDYPIVGLDPDDNPSLWNEKGEHKSGKESLRLVIQRNAEKD